MALFPPLSAGKVRLSTSRPWRSSTPRENRGAGSESEKTPQQEFIDAMMRERGYVLDYHKYLANADYEALVAANNLVSTVYLKGRSLDRQPRNCFSS